MTFNEAAWAIDGALTPSALARTEAFAAMSGAEGIVESTDLKVSALDTPGSGLQISAGSAVILNRYQGERPNQSYTVANPSVHTIWPDEMPPQSTSTEMYVVGVAVGDPEFSQGDHPFMPTYIPEGEEATYSYVRPMVLPTSAFVGTLGNQEWPFLPLALLTIPANTTTITGSMITADMRRMARPRDQLRMNLATATGTQTLSIAPGAGFQAFPSVMALSVEVPSWATAARVVGWVEGLRLEKSGEGNIAIKASDGVTTTFTSSTQVRENTPSTAKERRQYNVGGEMNVVAWRGRTVWFHFQGSNANSGSVGFLSADTGSSVMIQVFFEEVPT